MAATPQEYSNRANDDYYYPQQGSNPKRPSAPAAAVDQNYNKRPRPNYSTDDYHNNGPRAAVPVPPASSMDGDGRGRGRGSHLNVPAWMTTGSSTGGANTDGPQGIGGGGSSNSSYNNHNNTSSSYAQPPLNSSRFADPPPLQHHVPPGVGRGGVDAGRGRGRGSHNNLPAWMTNGTAGSSSSAVPPSQTAVAAHGPSHHDGGHYPATRLPPPPVRMEPPPAFTSSSTSSSNRGLPDAGPPGGGRGRGRGVSNLPAWMTQERYGDDV